MSFTNYRLSRLVESEFAGGPEWNTLVVQMASGAERRNAQWSMPHFKFVADYTILNPREQNEILDAFIAMRGKLHSFRFKDWNDFKILAEAMAVGDGTAAPRQLTKTYVFGPSSYTRKIKLPVASTLSVTANGSPLAVTVDDQTGLITPTGTWPSGQTIKVAYCEFDVPVRFGSDYYPFTQVAQSVSQVSIELQEVVL